MDGSQTGHCAGLDTIRCEACGGAQLTRQLSLIAKPASSGDMGQAPCAAMGAPGGCGAACPAFADCD